MGATGGDDESSRARGRGRGSGLWRPGPERAAGAAPGRRGSARPARLRPAGAGSTRLARRSCADGQKSASTHSRAAGPPGDADPPAVQDQPQAERSPLGAGQEGGDVGLDADGVGGVGEPEQPGQPGHVGVDRQPGQSEADAAHHVRRLAAHARAT